MLSYIVQRCHVTGHMFSDVVICCTMFQNVIRHETDVVIIITYMVTCCVKLYICCQMSYHDVHVLYNVAHDGHILFHVTSLWTWVILRCKMLCTCSFMLCYIVQHFHVMYKCSTTLGCCLHMFSHIVTCCSLLYDVVKWSRCLANS